MAGRPTKIPSIEKNRPDGSLFTRIEMEAEIRAKWVGHQPKRLRAINPYGLESKIAYDTPTIVILHWLLDEMIRRKEITGDSLGIVLNTPGHYDDPEVFNQFKQRLLIAVEQGIALLPDNQEGIDMNSMNLPPPPSIPGGPPSSGGYTPPPAPPMGAAPPSMGQPPPAPPTDQPPPAPPSAGQPPPATPTAAPATQAATGGLFPKDDPSRPWGKPAPSANRSRRTKQEMAEDQLWEKQGSPASLQFATFFQVYGVSYEQAKKQKMLGPGGEFPDPPASAAAPQQSQPQTQAQVPDMNQPPNNMPLPPGAPAPQYAPPPAPQMAPPPPAQGYAPPPPPTQAPPQGQAPQAQYAPPPPAHPQAPPVPPPPGMGAPMGAPPPMAAPQGYAPPPMGAPAPAPAPAVDLSQILANQDDIINRLVNIDAAIALQLRNQYQVGGDYTCASVLSDILNPK